MVVQRAPAVASLSLDHEIAQFTGIEPVPAAVGEPALGQPAPEVLEGLPIIAHGVARIAAFLGEILQERRQPFGHDAGRHRRRIRPAVARRIHGVFRERPDSDGSWKRDTVVAHVPRKRDEGVASQ